MDSGAGLARWREAFSEDAFLDMDWFVNCAEQPDHKEFVEAPQKTVIPFVGNFT
ncbi:MAG: hypothetical protein ABIT37_23830 [Luteolibacter sp.]